MQKCSFSVFPTEKPKIANVGNFCHVFAILRHLIDPLVAYSCRGDHKLRNEWSYIKIRQVLRSEMRKM